MKLIKKNLKWLVLIIVILSFIGLLALSTKLKSTSQIEVEENEIFKEENMDKLEDNKEEVPELVYVDIKGAVISPGVYEVEADKKVIDVINLAGGLSEGANTSLINLAKKVSNEMVVIIYTEEEVKKALEEESIAKIVDKECICPSIKNDGCLTQTETTKKTNDNDTNKEPAIVNINTASVEELTSISGIGESKAEAIIEYRLENGSFTTIEDIKNVPGIGDALYEKIKNYITV